MLGFGPIGQYPIGGFFLGAVDVIGDGVSLEGLFTTAASLSGVFLTTSSLSGEFTVTASLRGDIQ